MLAPRKQAAVGGFFYGEKLPLLPESGKERTG
jgi:hypothetical protein